MFSQDFSEGECSTSDEVQFDIRSANQKRLLSPERNRTDLADVEEVIAKELFQGKCPPPSGYICDICYTSGHFKNLCPLIRNRNCGHTPYQGGRRCLGEFICLKCKRKWSSHNSWANDAQKCVKCKIDVYPKKQKPLFNLKGSNINDDVGIVESNTNTHKMSKNQNELINDEGSSTYKPLYITLTVNSKTTEGFYRDDLLFQK